MPTISLFYGIQILMYFRDNAQHNEPHIHAKYQKQQAVFSIITGEVLAGTLPIKQYRLVQAWVELNRESLFIDWELAVNGEIPFKIEPL
jgi:hypothetical protein